jgi:hypothetical protein
MKTIIKHVIKKNEITIRHAISLLWSTKGLYDPDGSSIEFTIWFSK